MKPEIRRIMTTFTLFLTYAIIYYSYQFADTIMSFEESNFIFYIAIFNLVFIRTHKAAYNLATMIYYSLNITRKAVLYLEGTYYLVVFLGWEYSIIRLFNNQYVYNDISIVNIYNNISLFFIICYWCVLIFNFLKNKNADNVTVSGSIMFFFLIILKPMHV